MSCVIGIDIGTTSTVGILVRLPDLTLGLESRPVELSSPHPGWAEENPEQWWRNVCEITQSLIGKSGIAPGDIVAIGVAGMLPAIVVLDARDHLLRPSIQQSDGRCAEQVRQLRAELDETRFAEHAGNGINQQLLAAKTRWIEKHEPDVFAKVATVFGSYDYINFRLTGEKRVEQNWALEAGITELCSDALSARLLAHTHLADHVVPPRARSSEIVGAITAEAASQTGLAAGTPVVGGAADFVASGLVSGLTRRGDCLLKFGGSVDILAVSDDKRPDPRLFLDYHLIPGLYVPNGCMSTGGSALNWFAANLAGNAGNNAQAAGLSIHQYLDQRADSVAPRANGVAILPYFLGEKTPIHDPAARGAISGLSLSHSVAHLWRALLESYAYAIRHHIEVFAATGLEMIDIRASDGGSRSATWMQIVADVIQKPLRLSASHPGSCLGAAWTAAIGVGAADDWSAAAGLAGETWCLDPNPANADIYSEGYAAFRDLYGRMKDFEEGGARD
jgi:xylulokinase